MARRSQQRRTQRKDKQARRWQNQKPKNDKPQMPEHPGFDFATPPSVRSKPSATPGRVNGKPT